MNQNKPKPCGRDVVNLRRETFIAKRWTLPFEDLRGLYRRRLPGPSRSDSRTAGKRPKWHDHSCRRKVSEWQIHAKFDFFKNFLC